MNQSLSNRDGTPGVKRSFTMQSILAIFATLLVMLIASDGLVPAHTSVTALGILGFGLLLSSVVLAVTATSHQPRFSLMVTAIYFSQFLMLPGYRHLVLNSFPFYTLSYDRMVLETSAVIATGFFATVTFVYWIFASRDRPAAPPVAAMAPAFRPNLLLTGGLLFASLVLTYNYIRFVGLSNAFSVRGEWETADADGSTVGLLLALPRAATFITLIYHVMILRYGTSSLSLIERYFYLISSGAALLLFLVANWPPALARYYLFGYILVLGFVLVDMRPVRSRLAMVGGFLAGALILMPVVDMLTRRFGQGRLNYGELLDRYFQSGDFDGLQSIANAVLYVERNGIAWGNQLLSAALFFVPRSIWAGKGEPTGKITAEAAGYTFFNISQPLPSEFYVDFGLAGVFVLAIPMGYVMWRTDRYIAAEWGRSVRARLVAGFIVAYSIIAMRGSLLGVGPTIAVVLAGISLILWRGVRPLHRLRPRFPLSTVAPVAPRHFGAPRTAGGAISPRG